MIGGGVRAVRDAGGEVLGLVGWGRILGLVVLRLVTARSRMVRVEKCVGWGSRHGRSAVPTGSTAGAVGQAVVTK